MQLSLQTVQGQEPYHWIRCAELAKVHTLVPRLYKKYNFLNYTKFVNICDEFNHYNHTKATGGLLNFPTPLNIQITSVQKNH